MQMPGRINTNITYNELYRYNYNGMEMDKEVSGIGNSYTTEFRQYDPRLGRWKSLDPLMAKFPWMSPYCAFANNPIYFVDPYGLSPNPGDGEPKVGSTCYDEDHNEILKYEGDGEWSTADPGDFGGRSLNMNINGGAGGAYLAGQSGVEQNGRRFVGADERILHGEYVNKSNSTVWSIARANKRTPDQLRAWNPGLAGNEDKIGQGQTIYVDPPVSKELQAATILPNTPNVGGGSLQQKPTSKSVVLDGVTYVINTMVGTYIQVEVEGPFTGAMYGMIVWADRFAIDGYAMGKTGARSELISLGVEEGAIFTTGGNARNVTIANIAGLGWTADGNLSGALVDLGLNIAISDPYDAAGNRLIFIGGQVSVGVGTPRGSGGAGRTETKSYDW